MVAKAITSGFATVLASVSPYDAHPFAIRFSTCAYCSEVGGASPTYSNMAPEFWESSWESGSHVVCRDHSEFERVVVMYMGKTTDRYEGCQATLSSLGGGAKIVEKRFSRKLIEDE